MIVWTSALAVLAMLCGLAALFHRWVLYPVRLLQRGRASRGAGGVRLPDRPEDRRRDAGAGRGVQRHDRPAQRHLRRPRAPGPGAEPAARPLRAAGGRRVPRRRAWPTRSTTRWPRSPSAPRRWRAASAPMLDDRRRRPTPRSSRNYLRMIQEEAFRCKSITEKLLDFSRCGEIQRERTDLAGLIQGVVEMIRHMGKYRGKQIVFQPREAVMAHVDEPGDQAGRPEPGGQRAGLHGGRRHAPDRPPPRRGDGRDGLRRRRLRHAARGAGEHLRAVLHPPQGRQGDGPGAVDHPPDRQPAPGRDHGHQPRRGPGRDVHRPAPGPPGRRRPPPRPGPSPQRAIARA